MTILLMDFSLKHRDRKKEREKGNHLFFGGGEEVAFGDWEIEFAGQYIVEIA